MGTTILGSTIHIHSAAVLIVIVLITFLIAKELGTASNWIKSDRCNIVIFPLLLVFTMIVISKVIDTL